MDNITHQDVVNPTYHYKLVDLIDADKFKAEAHKVALLNARLDPIAWALLRDLLIALKVNK